MDTAENGGHYALILRRAAQDALDAHRAKDRSRLAAAMVELGRVLPDPPEDYDPRPYIAAHEWRFARTRPQNPHWYVLLVESADPYDHLRFLEWIRRHGDIEVHQGKQYRYQEVDGWRYWALGPNDTILNRRSAPGEQGSLDI